MRLLSPAIAMILVTTASLAADDDEFELDPPVVRPTYTLAAHLERATPPVFREGHTLLPLTRWGWSMPFEVRVALAERWGYALEFAGYLTHTKVDEVEQQPDSANARVVALAASDPQRYPLFVLTHRPLGSRDIEQLSPELRAAYYATDGEGNPILDPKSGKPGWRTLNPLAPDAIFEWAARETVAPLLRLREKAPIAIILNGGEYGLSVAGHGRTFWEQSPAVMAAKGERSWLDFISEQKARQELPIATAVRQAFPDRRLYLWYHFGGVPTWDPPEWSNGPALLAVSDLPDQSLYYRQFNTGWEGSRDLFTNFTHALAQAIALGHPLSYNWVCGGWKPDAMSPTDRYLGFLKCLYAAGQVGAVAGYFSLPAGIDGKPVGELPPPHLEQTMALAHAHGLFSHIEEFLRQGDLLPGPLPHARDPKLPAYEFGRPGEGLRVLVRRHREREAWLIAAWAASGEARETGIEVPGLGAVTVLARPAGSVYLATARHETDYEPPVATLDLLDTDPMDPTARWRSAAAAKP